MKIVKEYNISENNTIYEVKEYDNGVIVKSIKSNIDTEEPPQPTPQPTLEDKINFLYYKQIGVI